MASKIDAPRPTIDDWLTLDNRAWGFQHVREIVPSARIRRAAKPRPLPEKLCALDNVPVLSGGVTLDDYLRRGASGFLVLHRGTICYERYLNGLTPHTPHLLMSVSKSIVASVAGALIHAGSLSSTDDICSLLPELDGSAWEGCTVQHLLDMRGGVRFDESDDDPSSDLFVYEQIFQWRPLRQDLPSDIRQYMAGLQAERPHGGPFHYQSILTDMLAWVLEAVTGKRLSDLISELLWQPMGAEDDAELTVDRHGNAYADGGISATLRDMGRFGELWLGEGVWGESEVIPKRWIEDTVRPSWAVGPPSDYSHATAKAGGSRYYSQNWWIVDPTRRLYAARGYCGQAVYVDTSARLVVVLFSAWRENTSEQEQEVVDVVRSLAAALT
jgi:CubicO group peptidase (beta-lactamase class C family)